MSLRPAFRASPLIVLAVLLVLAPARTQAAEHIWSGIVLASKAEQAKAPPAELQRLAPRIERFFGYNQVELIGSQTKTIDEQAEKWLVPSQHFWLSVKSRRAPGEKVYTVQITLVHDKRTLVETQARLAPDSPLLIRGPMHERGQVLIVLQVEK